MSEQTNIDELTAKPFGRRMVGYWRVTGPGYMQSAMTLGGGTVASCAVLGSMFGYKYLWVQVLAMIFGYAVLSCVAKQTCNSEKRPYSVFWKELHPSLAILWAVSALVATVLWHIPQYSLSANGIVALAEGFNIDLDPDPARYAIGALLLAGAGTLVYLYGVGAKGLRIYEFFVKCLVWAIVGAFGIAAVTGGGIEWGRLFTGLTGIAFLRDIFSGAGMEEQAIKPVIAALAATVGINMIFLYPYTLLNKKWGKKYKELAYFDLLSGMAVPFLIATTFMIIAVAKTIGPEAGSIGVEVRDIREIIPVLEGSLGKTFAWLVIGLSMTAIGFSTIITHMLACGFIACEMFGFSHEGKAKFWFSLLPAIGVVGVVMKFPLSLAITASTLAMPLMPVTVICFIVLFNRKSYMGDEMPRGGLRVFWNAVLITSVVVMSWAAVYAVQKNWGSLKDKWLSPIAEEVRIDRDLGETERIALTAPIWKTM